MILFSQRVKLANEYQEWVNRLLPDGVRIKDCPESVISFLQGKGMLFKSEEIAALRAEVERLRAAYEAPPTSLTLDDLKQMEGEPVYIQYGDGKEGWDHVEDGLPIWLESDPDFINMTCSFDKDGHFGLHVLGWQAFRRRPEAARAALGREATHETETP